MAGHTAGNCIMALRQVAEKFIKPEDIDEFLLTHQTRVKELMLENSMIKQIDAESLAAGELMEQAKARALLEKRNAIAHIKNVMTITENLKTNYAIKDMPEGLREYLGGTNSLFRKGNNDSVYARIYANKTHATSSFITDLQKANLDQYFFKKENWKNIMIEMAEKAEGGKPGKTGDKLAQEIADILEKHQDYWRMKANDAGAYIQKLPGYSIAQTHDIEKLRPKKGETPIQAFERWRDDILPLLNTSKSFPAQDVENGLYEVWKGLESGVHLDFSDGIGIKKSGDRASRLSKHRTLIFNNGEDFYTYFTKYGENNGNFVAAYSLGLERLAKNYTIMDKLGVNPERTLKEVTDNIKLLARTSTESGAGKALDKIDSAGTGLHNKVKNVWYEISGKASIPSDYFLAKVMSEVRAANSMAMLGGSAISSFPDIAVQMSQMLYMGISRSESLGNIFKSLTSFGGRTLAAGEREMLQNFGIMAESIAHNLAENVNQGIVGKGFFSRNLNKYFRMNGLEYWTGAVKRAAGMSINNELTTFLRSAKELKDIAPGMQKMLNSYNIGEKEIALYKKMPLVESEGKFFLDPQNIKDIPDKTIAKYLGIDISETKQIRLAKDELAQKLRTFFTDRVQAASLEPGATTRAILHQGTQAGTVPGEFFRSFGQFKAFTVEMWTKGFAPWAHGNVSGLQSTLGLSELIFTSAALGYAAVVVKDLLSGKKPAPISPQEVMRGALQGGAMGIWGDILFSDPGNKGFAGALAGPTAGLADDAFAIWQAALKGEDLPATALKKVKGHIPYGNIFWGRVPINYGILYPLQEKANPGYLNRLERNLYNRNDQEYWLRPSDTFW